MAHCSLKPLTCPFVSIHRGAMHWQDRPATDATSAVGGVSAIARLRNIALITVALYLLFNWGCQQIRIPPQGGGGLPTAEVVLLLFLLTIDPPKTLARLGQRVYLLPFALWWTYELRPPTVRSRLTPSASGGTPFLTYDTTLGPERISCCRPSS